MVKVRVRHYSVRGNARGFWQPTKAMKALGFKPEACGQDGPGAWAKAEQLNSRWDRVRTGREIPPSHVGALKLEEAEELRAYPVGSIAEGFARYRRTKVWADKAAATRDDWWRGYKRIVAAGYHDCDARSFDLETVDIWYAEIRDSVSLQEAHRALKIWRALWKVLATMHYCEAEKDPSLAIRNAAPRGRTGQWSEGDLARIAKQAWRSGMKGLAVALSVMWDTQMGPVEAREFCRRQLVRQGSSVAVRFNRGKTGAEVVAALSRRSVKLLEAYGRFLGVEMTEDAPLLRNISGMPYRKSAMIDDFSDCRRAVYGSVEKRQMRDIRRSGAIEATAGEADPAKMGKVMGNSIADNRRLQQTYAPAQISNAMDVLAARRIGRRRMRQEE